MKKFGSGYFREIEVGYSRIDTGSTSMIPKDAEVIGFKQVISPNGNVFEYVVYIVEKAEG